MLNETSWSTLWLLLHTSEAHDKALEAPEGTEMELVATDVHEAVKHPDAITADGLLQTSLRNRSIYAMGSSS